MKCTWIHLIIVISVQLMLSISFERFSCYSLLLMHLIYYVLFFFFTFILRSYIEILGKIMKWDDFMCLNFIYNKSIKAVIHVSISVFIEHIKRKKKFCESTELWNGALNETNVHFYALLHQFMFNRLSTQICQFVYQNISTRAL